MIGFISFIDSRGLCVQAKCVSSCNYVLQASNSIIILISKLQERDTYLETIFFFFLFYA